jgi:hypothetical protein
MNEPSRQLGGHAVERSPDTRLKGSIVRYQFIAARTGVSAETACETPHKAPPRERNLRTPAKDPGPQCWQRYERARA